MFIELSNFGELEELNVCDNLGDHMIGNVYAKFTDEKGASNAYNSLAGKYYNGNLVQEEYSPVVNFQECRCRQYEEGKCERGGFCNFLHLKNVNRSLKESLFNEMYERHPEYKINKKKRNEEKKKKKHKHSSSESSLDSYDSVQRKKIIKKWNIKYQKNKELEEKKKEAAQAKINLALIEQKLMQTSKFAEDFIQPNENKKHYDYNKNNVKNDENEKENNDKEDDDNTEKLKNYENDK